MDSIGKIKRSSALFNASLLTLRCEDHDISSDKVIMDHVKKVKSGYIRAHQDILHLRDPLVHLALAFAHDAFFLVCPVGRDTFLSDLVHPFAAYLYLYPDSSVAHQRTVQSLISVVLRMVDPVAHAVFLIWIKSCDYREDVEALCTLRLF